MSTRRNGTGGGAAVKDGEPRNAGARSAPAVVGALKLAEGYLAGHGIESPRLNAEHLLAWILGCTRLDLYLRFDERLGDEALERYRAALRRRAGHYPLQYIIGSVEFYSLPFSVGEGVFVPRPETELVVERIEALMPRESSVRFLEMGVGSGVISVTLAVRNASWRGVGFDSSAEAARLARENAASLGVAGRLAICVADGFDAFAAAGAFDCLVANPPYIPSGDIDGLAEEVSRFESRGALDGGGDGMRYYPMLAAAGEKLLRAGGLLALEIGDGQAERVSGLLAAHRFEAVTMNRDYNGRERVVTALRPRNREGGSDG